MSIKIINKINNLVSEGQTEDAIKAALDHAKKHRPDLYTFLVILSNQYKEYKKKELLNINNSMQPLNKINLSLLSITDQFKIKKISKNRLKGKIVTIEKNKNYGFIKPFSRQYNENIFFHFSNLENNVTPRIGHTVSFELSTYRKKGVAKNIFITKKRTKRLQRPAKKITWSKYLTISFFELLNIIKSKIQKLLKR